MSTQITGVSWFEHLDTSTNFAGPGLFVSGTVAGYGSGADAASGPLAIGHAGPRAGMVAFECSHSVTNAFNQRLGAVPPGDLLALLQPGDAGGSPGGAGFPPKGHEIMGWYVIGPC